MTFCSTASVKVLSGKQNSYAFQAGRSSIQGLVAYTFTHSCRSMEKQMLGKAIDFRKSGPCRNYTKLLPAALKYASHRKTFQRPLQKLASALCRIICQTMPNKLYWLLLHHDSHLSLSYPLILNLNYMQGFLGNIVSRLPSPTK